MIEQTNLEARIKEFASGADAGGTAAQAGTDALAEEVKRREGAEQHSDELGQRRSQLEDQRAQLAQQLQEASTNCKFRRRITLQTVQA